MQVFIQFYILISLLFGIICTDPRITDLKANQGQTYALSGSSNNDTSNEKKEHIPELHLTPEDERIANHPNLNLLPAKCGFISEDRIVGGVQAKMFTFPWMAVIIYQKNKNRVFGCGGSIISKRYVLTAAHCVQNKTIAIVRLGEYDTKNDVDCEPNVCEGHLQDIENNSFVIHKDYTNNGVVTNDIALVRLSEDVDTKWPNVNYICLPTTTELRHRILDNANATISGWGHTENSTMSQILRAVILPIYTHEQCASTYKSVFEINDPNLTVNQLCAGAEEKNICTGDSGGPLIVPGMYTGTLRYIQYGIAVYGKKHCSEIPGLFTDVRKYMGWILDNMRP